MSVSVVAFFNNKGGVGKTSLVYHLSWMYADLGLKVLAADLDPQANLTAAFYGQEQLEELWNAGDRTIAASVGPLMQGTGDISEVRPALVTDILGLLPGALSLSAFEEELSDVWPRCLGGNPRAFRVMSAFWRIMQQAARQLNAAVILMDLGPNLGAINRAALIAADYVVVPLSPDLFSLEGLHSLGPTLLRWRQEWKERLRKNPEADLPLPDGRMEPAGYVVQQHSVRLDRPVKAYEQWIARIPQVYSEDVLKTKASPGLKLEDDPHCLALLKHYRSLIPMAKEARKPVFHLKAADGAIGAHLAAVQEAYKDFKHLAHKVAGRIALPLPAVA
ncbi:MAG: AAA family ATPase [Bryobacterales bacterium]|nr:AAA family ATPase [Bryobacterales bacterium]